MKENITNKITPIVKKNDKKQKVIQLINITKTFLGGKIIANKDVNLEVEKNEIHAICGENGAGKSTLMSILFGLYSQDSGDVFVNGKKVKFKNAADATKFGLGMVHQHFKLVQIYSLLENIILGSETVKYGFLDRKTSIKKIEQICQKYNLHIDLHAKTKDVSVGQQQRVEIIKLLYRGADILIFDEPTAVLSDEEIKSFLKMLLFLKKQGKTIIIITHKLNEVKQVADRITVLRRGSTIGTYGVNDLSESQIVEKMVGNKVVIDTNTENFEDKQKTILSIENLFVKKISNPKQNALNGINLTIKPGEIYGIAGIEGNGQTELALAINGLQKVSSGYIKYNNNGIWVDLANKNPKEISDLGISHVPEDRHKHGIILDETVAFNLVSNQLNNNVYNKFGFLKLKEVSLNAVNLCGAFDIRGANRGKAIARSLSGGNQQKLVVARELYKKHKLIVLAQPTRGLDVGAINFIHEKIIDRAKRKEAILLISYELDELIKVCSKISVIDQGKIVFTGYKNKISRAQLGKYLLRTEKKKVGN